MSAEVIVSIVATVVAVASAAVAYVSLREQRRLTTNVTSYTQIATAEAWLDRHPELLALHGITDADLQACGVTAVEVAYLAQSFGASEFFHRINGHTEVEITPYRKALLDQPKVRLAWQKLIRGRLVADGPFAMAVEKYLDSTPSR